MTLHALKAPQDDTATEVIVAISKIPSPTVAQKVLSKLTSMGKPSVVIFMGESPSGSQTKEAFQEGLYLANTLEEATLAAAALARKEKISGGTLCEEAMSIQGVEVGLVWSNAPLTPEHKLTDSHKSSEHCAVDLGEEEFTVGRLHPMIDHDLRIRRLYQEAQDMSVALIQMDVVLGYGAHPYPASELAPAIEKARNIAEKDGPTLTIVVSITGTEGDPQGLDRQRETFERSDASVAESKATASTLAALTTHGHAST